MLFVCLFVVFLSAILPQGLSRSLGNVASLPNKLLLGLFVEIYLKVFIL